MVICAIVCAAALAAGFGLGRVKNAAKLKAVSSALAAAEGKVGAEAAKLIADIKSKL